nr:hypothetical protein [uncultured Arsenicibacter sp.]
MKHTLHVIFLALLLAYPLGTYAQCRQCPDSPNAKQPTSLTFNGDGVLISRPPTVISTGTVSSLTIVVNDEALPKNIPLQESIVSLTGVTTIDCPECLTSTLANCLTLLQSPTSTSGICNTVTISSISSLTADIQKLRQKTYTLATEGISSTFTSVTTNPPSTTGSNLWTEIPLHKESGKIVFKLIKKDADNLFLKDQFDKTKRLYKNWEKYKPLYSELIPIYKHHSAIIDQLTIKKALITSATACCGTASLGASIDKLLCDHLDFINASQVQLCQIANTVFNDNIGWISAWLWYTKGKPLLNPFGISSPAAENAQRAQRLVAAEEELRLYQALQNQCCQTTTAKDMIALLKAPVAELAVELADLRKYNTDEAPVRQKKYAAWLKSKAQTEEVLNEVVLYASDCHEINWMTHYDAGDDYAQMYSNKLLPDLVYEHDAVRGLVHNLPADKKVSAKEVIKEAKLHTELDKEISPFFDAFSQASTGSDAVIQLVDRLKVQVAFAAFATITGRKTPKIPELLLLCSEIIKKLEAHAKARELINWLSAQTEPPVDDLKKAYKEFDDNKDKQAPTLRSEDVLVGESRKAKGTNDISYQIFEAGKEKPVAADSFKTYNTVRFWPSVSINYVFGSRAVSIFDNATGQFRTNTDIDNFEAVVGVKWYWGPSNVTRTRKRTRFIEKNLAADDSYKFERGNSWRGKVFLTGGLGVSHKFLRNYFLGAGVDVVPGLSVQAGGNLFFRKAYDLNNGQIKREYDIPSMRMFFGLAIDPNVVTKLISIF